METTVNQPFEKENTAKEINLKKQRIGSLGGLKFIAVLLMFYWHSELTSVISPAIDFGARCCEFLFVVSGFLVAMNFKKKQNNTFNETIYYTTKKLIKCWPLHIAALIIILYLERATFCLNKLFPLFLNLFLLHSWSPDYDVAFSFNGVSWFLSAIMFCYALTPLLIKLCKNYKLSTVLLAVLIVFRIVFDRFIYGLHGVNKVINIHTSSIIGLSEFLMGMFSYPLFAKIKQKITISGKSQLIIFSIAEAVCLGGLILCMLKIDFTRGEFSVLMALLTMVFAFDNGIISKFLSLKPFKLLSGIQFEFYILHAVTLIVIESIFYKIIHFKNPYIVDAIALLILISVCFIYNKFISKHIEKMFKKGFNFLYKVLKISVTV